MNCIIIDDDSMFQQLLIQYLKKESIEVVSCFNDAAEAVNYVNTNDIDLIFLDIHMPQMNGIQFLETINNKYPKIILTTSDSSFALDAYKFNVSGYLVKPFSYADFKKAFDKANYYIIESEKEKSKSDKTIYIKKAGARVKIDKNTVQYIQCIGDYATIYTKSEKFILHGSMKEMEKIFPSPDFVRVHRSYIINSNIINIIEDDSITYGDISIPIGKTYKQQVYSILKIK